MVNQVTTQTTCPEQMGTVLSFHLISLQIPQSVFLAALRNALVAEHMFFSSLCLCLKPFSGVQRQSKQSRFVSTLQQRLQSGIRCQRWLQNCIADTTPILWTPTNSEILLMADVYHVLAFPWEVSQL